MPDPVTDNTRLNQGGGGDLISTELLPSGAKIERVKVVTGAAGVDGGDVTVANPFPVANAPYELRVAQGLVSGVLGVYKFGGAPSGIQTTATDVWARADAAATQQIWVAPTQARLHGIASSSDVDGKTGAPTSAGARTIRVYGLTSWTAAETSEVVTLDGTTSVNTVSSYVIIHRMKVLTAGTTSINVGTITATAAVDGSITAVIDIGDGQTEMAIYGIPSVQTFYMTTWGASINDIAAQTRVDLHLEVNESPDVSPLNTRFIRKGDLQIQNSGSSLTVRNYNPYFPIPGPAIIKLQATANAADVDLTGSFQGYLVTN